MLLDSLFYVHIKAKISSENAHFFCYFTLLSKSQKFKTDQSQDIGGLFKFVEKLINNANSLTDRLNGIKSLSVTLSLLVYDLYFLTKVNFALK